MNCKELLWTQKNTLIKNIVIITWLLCLYFIRMALQRERELKRQQDLEYEASQKADMEKVHKKQYRKRKRMTF